MKKIVDDKNDEIGHQNLENLISIFSTEQVTNNEVNFLEITRLFSEDDFAENNCFDGKNLYAYPCRGKCFQYIGLYESNVI